MQRQLRWRDVQVEADSLGGKAQKLARITVRAETSKVLTTGTLLCRNGQSFERLRELVTHTSNDAYIFRVDGDQMLSKRANPLRTTQFRLPSNLPFPKNRYPINKPANKRLENTH